MAAGGATLAAIASRENYSREAEELMSDLAQERTPKKETGNGKTIYFAATHYAAPSSVQAVTQAEATTAPSPKFCRNCDPKIPSESNFCESCGTSLLS